MNKLIQPRVAERMAPLPSLTDLKRRGISFEPLTSGAGSPVRLIHKGEGVGIFSAPEKCSLIIRQLTQQ